MSSVAVMPVNIYRYDGESTIETTPFQLCQWVSALRLEAKGMTMSGGRKVSTYLRKRLGAPRSYTNAMLLEYISTCKADIDKQLGV